MVLGFSISNLHVRFKDGFKVGNLVSRFYLQNTFTVGLVCSLPWQWM